MQNWLLMALIAPFLWALVAIVDTYFVHDVYEDEYDGMVVSGVFQLLPWLLVPVGAIEFTFSSAQIAGFAFVAGGMLALSFFCYFKALFIRNDAVLMQTLWTVGVPVVPFFAYFLIGEVLTSAHYAGIGIAFIGILLFNFDGNVKRIGFSRIVFPMVGAIVFFSLYMVFARKAHDLSPLDFWSVYLLFSFGATATAFAVLVIAKKNAIEKARKIVRLSGKYFYAFLCTEGLYLAGTITSQKAISLAPAVSFVVVIESLVPVFVMVVSLFLMLVLKRLGNIAIGDVYRQQLSGVWIKILALVFLAIGIYTVA
ncbi:MAG: DMT family transporter [Candidatus Moranbacteria bacterium]|nr:DMT family transporter [Candidatus Moranbacteria bacterium]